MPKIIIKKYFYLLIGLIILGGVAFGVAKSELLKGVLNTGMKLLPSAPEIEMKVENIADLAAEAEIKAATYMEEALAGLENLKKAFEDDDQDALKEAKNTTDEAATNAETSAEDAQKYAEEAQAEAAVADANYEAGMEEENLKEQEVAELLLTSKSEGVEAQNAYEAWQEAQEAYDQYITCLSTTNSGCGSFDKEEIEELETVYNNAKTAADKRLAIYETAQADYQALIAENEDYKQIKDDLEILALAAEESANAAKDSASQAREYANEALNYKLTLLSCETLTLSPDYYSIAAEDAEASFDLTASLKLNDGESIEINIPNTSIPDLPSINTFDWSLLNNFTVAPIGDSVEMLTSTGIWEGNLIFETNGKGKFTYDSKTENPLEVKVTEKDTAVTVNFTGGTAGDTLLVYLEEEENVCIASFDIDQAEAQVTDITEDDLEPLPSDTAEEAPVEEDTSTETLPSDTAEEASNEEFLEETTEEITNDTSEKEDNFDEDNNDEPSTAGEIIATYEYTCSDPFLDIHEQWYEELVCRAYKAEIVRGRTDTTFVPDDNMTRAEWIKVITLVFGLDPDDAKDEDTNFLDVSENDWFYNYIVIAEDEDIIRIRDGSYYFNPNEDITRADAMLFAIRAADLSDYDYDVASIFSDVDNSDYFAYALAIANETMVTDYNNEATPIIEGYSDGTFRPYNNISRSEAMAIAIRAALAWGIAAE